MNTHKNDQSDDRLKDSYAPAPAASPVPATANAQAAVPAALLAAAPAVAAEPPLPPIMDADGAFAPDWYARFEELQPYAATLAKFHRPEALAKSYANLEKLRGYPDPQDTRRMAAFRLAVGLPESADDYVIPRPEDAPDETWDADLVANLSKVAYEYGVPAPAMEALSKRYAHESCRMLEACRQAEQAAIEQADSELQEEWGRAYEENMQTVGTFLNHLGERCGVDVKELAECPALRANADFARLMLAAASLLQEAPLRTGAPMDSKDEARRIAQDPAHPLHEAYMRTSHPQHRYANEQYDRFAFGRKL